MAAIALFRLHAYTNDARHRDLAESTLKAFAGIAAHYGLFASTYGIALGMYLRPHTQVVIVGSGTRAEQLESAAHKHLSLNQSVLHLQEGEAVAADASAGSGRNHSQFAGDQERPHGGRDLQRLQLQAADCRTSGTGEGPGFFLISQTQAR